MAYGYIDKTDRDVFHVVAEKRHADEAADSGKVVEFAGTHENGYPTNDDGVQLVVYTDTLTEKEGLAIPAAVKAAIESLK